MKIKAHAKINLSLKVLNKREDGYHELDMVMAPVELHDLIYIDIIESGIIIESNNIAMPTDERNIAFKAAKLMIEKFNIDKGVKMFIYKHIPSQAGLAGGSADGAAVLKALNKLFRLNLSNDDLCEVGKQIGADVPFCIKQQLSRVKGIGEHITPINTNLDFNILIVKPRKGVSTKKAFSSIVYDNLDKISCDDLESSLLTSDYKKFNESLSNDLEIPSIKLVPDIEEIKLKMEELGFDSFLMSGSGSSVFGITKDLNVLNKGFIYFKNNKNFVRKTKILTNN